MSDKITYRSPTWRIQLAVWDLRGPYSPKDREPLNFSVSIMPTTVNRFASFSASGSVIYYGPSLSEAINACLPFLPKNKHPVLPKSWRPYIMERM